MLMTLGRGIRIVAALAALAAFVPVLLVGVAALSSNALLGVTLLVLGCGPLLWIIFACLMPTEFPVLLGDWSALRLALSRWPQYLFSPGGVYLCLQVLVVVGVVLFHPRPSRSNNSGATARTMTPLVGKFEASDTQRIDSFQHEADAAFLHAYFTDLTAEEKSRRLEVLKCETRESRKLTPFWQTNPDADARAVKLQEITHLCLEGQRLPDPG